METIAPLIDQVPPPPLHPLRLLVLPRARESYWTIALSFLSAIAIAAGFFWFINQYNARGPGDIGVDENAYLVGGKMMAEHGTPAIKPSSPFAYVGPMWILTADGSYHPKYPAGVPLLNAIAIRIGGSPMAAYWVSPICGVVSVLAMFLLVRVFAGSICGVLAALLLATNPSAVHFALVPSSHAPDLAFTMLGMTALFYWWRSGRAVLGVIGGLCIGFTISTRYSDGLLLAPLGIAALTTLRFRSRRSWYAAAVPVLAWCVPFFALLIFNRLTMGHWTGYDTTNESTGFSAKDFGEKWQYTIHQLDIYGVFFILPLGVLGLSLMVTNTRWWKPGLVLTLWFAPTTLLYMAYYWGLETPGLMYLRFFVAVFPAAIAAAMWLVSMTVRGIAAASVDTAGTSLIRPSLALYFGAFVFTVLVAAEGVFVSRDELPHLRTVNTGVRLSGEALLAAIPAARADSKEPAPLMFGEDIGVFSRQLMHFQFISRGEWFSATAFTLRGNKLGLMFGNGPKGNEPGSSSPPVLIQKERLAKNGKLYRETSFADLAKAEAETIHAALNAGRGAYAVLMPTSIPEFQSRLGNEGFEITVVGTWHDPSAPVIQPIVVQKPTTTPASTAPTTAPQNQPSSDNPGFLGRLFADKNQAPPPRPTPAKPFVDNDENLTLPTLRLPRMFDTAADLQFLKITAKPTTPTPPR